MSFGMAYATKKKNAKFHHPDQRQKHERGVNTQDTDDGKRGESIAGTALRSGDKRGAKEMVRESISEAREMPKPALPMADGGDVSEHEQDADMIARIMHKRKEYAQGGVVANEDAPIADSIPAEFDDMEVDDHLEADEDGSNEHGDDDVGDDPIDRIMMKRKKDKMPRPA